MRDYISRDAAAFNTRNLINEQNSIERIVFGAKILDMLINDTYRYAPHQGNNYSAFPVEA